MKILFVSKDLNAANLALLLKEEGHDVKLHITEKKERGCFENLVPKTDSWRKELKWVGRDGLIVFDNVGFGEIQDKLRSEGYTVFGGSSGEMIETDRSYGESVFRASGISTPPLYDFENIDEAIRFIKRNKKKWVLKYSSNYDLKNYSFIGSQRDGLDTLHILENYKLLGVKDKERITLQERIEGIEIGVGRFFNGTDWVGPIEYNIEHTRFFTGNLGPTIDEMGTLAWYATNEHEKLYRSTLARIKPFLIETDFRGDIEINCIVNRKGIFPLEATARIGSPIVHLQTALHTSPWGDFLYAIARGEDYNLKWKKGYGVVVLLAIPPFPYKHSDIGSSSIGTNIFFDKKFTKRDGKNIHFDEVASLYPKKRDLFVAGPDGYVMFVTGTGSTVEKAQANVYRTINKIHIPRMMYRTDIGSSFAKKDRKKLRSWGYL